MNQDLVILINPSGELQIGNFGVLAAPAPATANEGQMSCGNIDTAGALCLTVTTISESR